MIMRLTQMKAMGIGFAILLACSINVLPNAASEDNNSDNEILTGSDWFEWTMNGTHRSVLAITNESLNWTHSVVSIITKLEFTKNLLSTMQSNTNLI